MKKFRKTAAFLLTAVLAAGLLAGCGDKPGSGGGSTERQSQAADVEVPEVKALTVEEVYGAGYGKVAVDGKTGGKKTFDLTDKDTDTSALAAAFENKEPTPTFSQGVINRYADKKYVRDGE